MGYEAEEIGNFRSHSPLSHDDPVQMDLPTETSIFLPEDTSDNDISSYNSVYSDPNNRTSNSVTHQVARSASTLSRNLGILVISEGLPGDNEKEVQSLNTVQVDKSGSNDFDSDTVTVKGGCCRNYTGILLTLASGIVFVIGGLIVKYLRDFHPFTLAVFRFQGILLPGLLMVLYTYYVKKVPVFEPVWPLTQKPKAKRVVGLIVRSVFGTTALLLHFYALQRIDVADALVIGSCQPVFVTLAAYFLLGEACGVFPIFTALLTIIGVGVISRPPILTGQESFDEDTLIGAGFSVFSMLTATMVFVIIRYLKDVHVSLITFVLGCWGTIQSIVCSVVIGEFTLPQTLEHWLLAGALAGITLLGQVTMTLALQCEQAGNVAVVRTCDCLFAFLLQFVLLNTVPDMFSLTGASIIIFGVLLTAFRKWITTLPRAHPTRKRFWFVMA